METSLSGFSLNFWPSWAKLTMSDFPKMFLEVLQWSMCLIKLQWCVTMLEGGGCLNLLLLQICNPWGESTKCQPYSSPWGLFLILFYMDVQAEDPWEPHLNWSSQIFQPRRRRRLFGWLEDCYPFWGFFCPQKQRGCFSLQNSHFSGNVVSIFLFL